MNTNKQLLVDWIPFDVSPEQINESIAKNDGKIIVSGILQRAEHRNQNGRVYPRETLMREAKKYADVQIRERRALGELDHPDSEVVNLQNCSHNILEVHWKGNDLMGTLEVLGTPSGNILRELLKSNIKLGISSRALGSVKEINKEGEESTVEVQPDLEIISWDVVSNPSTQNAFLNLNEGIVRKSGRTCGKWCRVESIINDIMRREN